MACCDVGPRVADDMGRVSPVQARSSEGRSAAVAAAAIGDKSKEASQLLSQPARLAWFQYIDLRLKVCLPPKCRHKLDARSADKAMKLSSWDAAPAYWCQERCNFSSSCKRPAATTSLTFLPTTCSHPFPRVPCSHGTTPTTVSVARSRPSTRTMPTVDDDGNYHDQVKPVRSLPVAPTAACGDAAEAEKAKAAARLAVCDAKTPLPAHFKTLTDALIAHAEDPHSQSGAMSRAFLAKVVRTVQEQPQEQEQQGKVLGKRGRDGELSSTAAEFAAADALLRAGPIDYLASVKWPEEGAPCHIIVSASDDSASDSEASSVDEKEQEEAAQHIVQIEDRDEEEEKETVTAEEEEILNVASGDDDEDEDESEMIDVAGFDDAVDAVVAVVDDDDDDDTCSAQPAKRNCVRRLVARLASPEPATAEAEAAAAAAAAEAVALDAAFDAFDAEAEVQQEEEEQQQQQQQQERRVRFCEAPDQILGYADPRVDRTCVPSSHPTLIELLQIRADRVFPPADEEEEQEQDLDGNSSSGSSSSSSHDDQALVGTAPQPMCASPSPSFFDLTDDEDAGQAVEEEEEIDLNDDEDEDGVVDVLHGEPPALALRPHPLGPQGWLRRMPWHAAAPGEEDEGDDDSDDDEDEEVDVCA